MTIEAVETEQRLSVAQLATKLGYTEWTVRLMIRNREIGHVRRGAGRGRVFVLPSQIDAYLRSRTFPAKKAA